MSQPVSVPVRSQRLSPLAAAARAWASLRMDPATAAAAAVVAAAALAAVLAPWLAPHDPYAADVLARLKPPGTPGHPLGTDHLGRDLLSRLLYGARTTLAVGVASVLLAAGGGVPLGLLAGFYGGWLDGTIMRLIDVLMAFPSVLLAIAIIAALGPGLTRAMVAVGIVGIPYYARIVRSLALSLKQREFVEAARAMGAPGAWILSRHILPHCVVPVVVAATLDVGWMITAAAGMSFLGLGAQPPAAEWGLMLSEGRQYIRVAPHVSVLPGFAIFLVVLAFNVLGDWVRDRLEPRRARSGALPRWF